MLSGLCFVGVNLILSIIIKDIMKGNGVIDNYFLAALTLTVVGNIFLLSVGGFLGIVNTLISLCNTITSYSYMFIFKK